ncbi:MAG: ActS/PrrB/RegB family redox-sensitive histidine kinase [Litoreibacter sp.]|nr:ActS/PrrB/RegB family redox-sensitive histidine kinase [Litoreibacter sp.]
MADLSEELLRSGTRNGLVRLQTLINLRWLAIVGQSITVLYASYMLELRIELGLCLIAIGASVISNLVAIFVYPQNTRLPEREVMLTMLFDLSQLAFLVYLTGGLNNPFAVLILAPVTVSAMTLQPRSTLLLGGLAVILVSVLAFYFVPLRTAEGFILRMPQVFVFGFWVALMIGIIFLGIYAARVTRETHAMSQALLATQMALSREQKLTDLGGVVAAAAHELGTPLATIKLVSNELLEELEDRPELKEDAALIKEQADRCRVILQSMGRAGKDDLHLRSAPLGTVIEESADPHSNRGKKLHFNYGPALDAPQRMPNILRKPEIIHGLRNLIQNAVDFAEANVWIDGNWDGDQISVRVIDDGTGYPPDLLGRIGDPFLKGRKKDTNVQNRPGYEGMGLGLFIAKTLLERSGAEVTFANGSGLASETDSGPARSGAIAEVTWPNGRISAAETGKSQALGENKPIRI